MANKKSDESVKDKLKTFFRFSKEKSTSVTYQRPQTKEFVFTAEILRVCTCVYRDSTLSKWQCTILHITVIFSGSGSTRPGSNLGSVSTRPRVYSAGSTRPVFALID